MGKPLLERKSEGAVGVFSSADIPQFGPGVADYFSQAEWKRIGMEEDFMMYD